MKILMALLLLSVLSVNTAISREAWAPENGYCSVNQRYAYNKFRFNVAEGTFSEDATYEHETQVYNIEFADYGGSWRSNLPRAYYDTPFLDDIDNFTIGSAQASSIKNRKTYTTYMKLKKGNNSDCRGCCSGHGGVCFSNGVTSCCDGTFLSETCVNKGCDQSKNHSTVRIKGQLGERTIPFCYSTWCIFAQATTGSMAVITAPYRTKWVYP